MNETLKARVFAKNKANKIANELRRELKEYFRDKVGQKIVKNDGSSFLQKIKEDLSWMWEYENNDKFISCRFIFQDNQLFLKIEVKEIIEGGTGSCMCQESCVYVGDLRDGVLHLLKDEDDLREDYNVETILKLRDGYKELLLIAAEFKGSLYRFGEDG